GQSAYEHADLKHGLFFHAVLEGLRGKAKNEDGEVTWDDLALFVKRQVKRQVPKLVGPDAQQSPSEFKVDIEGLPVLLRVAKLVKGKQPREIENSIGMKLVLIPAGKFMMGSPKDEKNRRSDEQQHQVEISKAFYLGAYEVTQGEYEKVMGKN